MPATDGTPCRDSSDLGGGNGVGRRARTIARDLLVSYRLLGYIKSAFFGVRRPVRSIGQALALLGIENLKHWAALSIFASIDGKPAELTSTALIRARFCELAGRSEPATDPGELFTLGLFSVLDALMDAPMTELLTKLPFPQDMRDALTEHHGAKGRLLDCVTAIEAGDLDRGHAIIPNAARSRLCRGFEVFFRIWPWTQPWRCWVDEPGGHPWREPVGHRHRV
jgi:c-di-GMP-related signal transduction protein